MTMTTHQLETAILDALKGITPHVGTTMNELAAEMELPEGVVLGRLLWLSAETGPGVVSTYKPAKGRRRYWLRPHADLSQWGLDSQ